MRHLIHSLMLRLTRLQDSVGGVAAVEFALILPLMVLLLLSTAELSWGISMDRKVTLASRTMADLTARQKTVDAAMLNTIFAASTSVMAPYSDAGVSITVRSVGVINTGTSSSPNLQGRECWRRTNGGALANGASIAMSDVPDGFRIPDSSFIEAVVSVPYNPRFGYGITGGITLSETTQWPVRNPSDAGQKEVRYTGLPPCFP